MSEVPETKFPDNVAKNYSRGLVSMVDDAAKKNMRTFREKIVPLMKKYKKRYSGDMDEFDMIIALIEAEIARQITISFETVAEAIITRNLRFLNEANATMMTQQIRVLSVSVIGEEPWVQSFLKTSIKENLSYVQNIKDEYYANMQRIIYQGIKKDQSVSDIAEQLQKQIGMTKNRAEFVAVDQTGTIFGQLTARRHQEAGIKRFRWQTSEDEKVRKTHRELADRVFNYDDPPSIGLPGEDYRCRCVATPVFDGEDE